MAERYERQFIHQWPTLHPFAEFLVGRYAHINMSPQTVRKIEQGVRLMELGYFLERWGMHKSHADYPILHGGLTEVVSKEYAHNDIPLMGSRLADDPRTSFLRHAFEGIYIESAKDNIVNNEKERIRRKESIDDSIIAVSLSHQKGKSATIFPEGGRSSDDNLENGYTGLGKYPRMMGERGIIQPFVVIGAKDVLPKHGMKPRHADVELVVGDFIYNEYLLNSVKGLSEKEGNRAMVDHVMSKIAELLNKNGKSG